VTGSSGCGLLPQLQTKTHTEAACRKLNTHRRECMRLWNAQYRLRFHKPSSCKSSQNGWNNSERTPVCHESHT